MENSPFIDGLPSTNGDFHGYVKQPGGISLLYSDCSYYDPPLGALSPSFTPCLHWIDPNQKSLIY